MKELHINLTVAALTLGLAFSIGALAEGMSKESYKADKEKIEADYKVAKATCASLAGNQKDICIAEAKGKEKVGLADGRQLGVPLAFFPRLLGATPTQRMACVISGGGIGLHWDELDEDISVPALFAGNCDLTASHMLAA